MLMKACKNNININGGTTTDILVSAALLLFSAIFRVYVCDSPTAYRHVEATTSICGHKWIGVQTKQVARDAYA